MVLAASLSDRLADATGATEVRRVPVRMVGARQVGASSEDPLSWDRMADRSGLPRVCAFVREDPKTVLKRAVRKLKRAASASVFQSMARRFATSPEVGESKRTSTSRVAVRSAGLSTAFHRQRMN